MINENLPELILDETLDLICPVDEQQAQIETEQIEALPEYQALAISK